MDDTLRSEKKNKTLLESILIYAGLFLVNLFFIILACKTDLVPGFILFILYISSGIILNRVVLRSLIEWHPMHNTIHNIFSAKIKSMLFWPISYSVLFFKLAINKIL